MLDAGGAALAATLPSNQLTTLSLAFTGVADGTCTAIAAALTQGCKLATLNLSGCCCGPRGLVALAAALGAAPAALSPALKLPKAELKKIRKQVALSRKQGLEVYTEEEVEKAEIELEKSGHAVNYHGSSRTSRISRISRISSLTSLDLSANQRLDASSLAVLAHALPSTALRTLRLMGCDVSAHVCGLIAAALATARLTELDLGANPFGDEGAWSLAWAMPEPGRLRSLGLSNCEVSEP